MNRIVNRRPSECPDSLIHPYLGTSFPIQSAQFHVISSLYGHNIDIPYESLCRRGLRWSRYRWGTSKTTEIASDGLVILTRRLNSALFALRNHGSRILIRYFRIFSLFGPRASSTRSKIHCNTGGKLQSSSPVDVSSSSQDIRFSLGTRQMVKGGQKL